MEKSTYFNQAHYKHWIDEHVRFSDLDPLGHVNNNAIGQYFENARAALYMELTPNWPYRETILVLARSAIDFARELHMPADLRIATGILRLGRTSMTSVNALFHDGNGVAVCESVSVLIDRKSRKPLEIPSDIRQVALKYSVVF